MKDLLKTVLPPSSIDNPPIRTKPPRPPPPHPFLQENLDLLFYDFPKLSTPL